MVHVSRFRANARTPASHRLGHCLKRISYKCCCLASGKTELNNSPIPKMTPPRSLMEKELAELMSRIRKSERALDVMYDKAAALEKLLSGSGDTHPDISILPVEILGMIFKKVVGQSGVCVEYQSSHLEADQQERQMVRPELFLSHVSEYWRTVAIGIPLLWTHIHLYVKQSADLVNLYITRSRGLPLIITFQQYFFCDIHPREAYSADYSRITTTILNHMHFCRRLEIRTNVSVPELLEGIGRSRAHLLEEFVLYHPCNVDTTFSSSSFPKLAHLEVGELVSISTTMPIKTLQTLNSLTLAGLPAFRLPAPTFLDLMSRLQSLSRLTLLDEAVYFERLHPTDIVKMPSLRFLMLKPGPDISRVYLTGLMETIITPALEELVLDFTDVASSREIQLFLRHLKREAPQFLSLRHLTIVSPFASTDIASALVRAAPNIEHLSLSRYSVDSVLMYLTHDARSDAFSKLCTLEFDSPHFGWDVVLSFLQKRKQLGRPLGRLTFQGFGGSEGEVLDDVFRKLLDACLIV